MLPRPPVILAIMSLPQNMPQVRNPQMRSKITRIVIKMPRRTLRDFLGCFSGFSFLVFSGFSSSFRASTGARKSSTKADSLALDFLDSGFGSAFGFSSTFGSGFGSTGF